MTFNKVNFICSVCGEPSWLKVNLKTYVISEKDLVCDNCYPSEDEK